MHQRSDVIYLYDGSFEGFLCCVFESFLQKLRPYDIIAEDANEPSLMAQQWIDTDPRRVAKSGSAQDAAQMAAVEIAATGAAATPRQDPQPQD